jgi:hypothetical protein
MVTPLTEIIVRWQYFYGPMGNPDRTDVSSSLDRCWYIHPERRVGMQLFLSSKIRLILLHLVGIRNPWDLIAWIVQPADH